MKTMEREELIKSKEYWISKLQIDLFNEVEAYMKKNKLTRTQFAEKLGVSKGYVSQILNGDADHRMSKFIELTLSIGLIPSISFEEIKDFFNRDKIDASNITIDDIEKSKDILFRSGYLLSHRPINRCTDYSCASQDNSEWKELPDFPNQLKTPLAS